MIFFNYKMKEVKQYTYLQNPQLVFYTPRFTHNSCLTQCQSILLMVLVCMLTPVRSTFEDIQGLVVKTKKLNIQITTTMKS